MSELLEKLTKLYPDSSRRTLKNWMKWGRVQVDGEQIKLQKKPDSVLYFDKELVVIEKPTGLLSVPDDNGTPSAQCYLRKRFKTLYAVHRLDRDASGVLLFARTLEMKRKLARLFEAHDLEREYVAVVEGKLTGSGSWRYPLLELDSFRVVVSSEGRECVTHYESLATNEQHTLLRLRLETGRKHQIRVHCQRAGHAIVGDKRYGSENDPFKRMALHAVSLSLEHPTTKKLMTFKSKRSPSWANPKFFN